MIFGNSPFNTAMAYKQTLLRIVFFAALILVLDNVPRHALDLNALSLPASRLIKTALDPTVYYISPQGVKLPIPSAEIFLSYGNEWADIEIISQAEIDFYKAGKYIKLVDHPAVYRLDSGIKRHVTAEAAAVLELPFNEIIIVNKFELNSYQTLEKIDATAAAAVKAADDAAESVSLSQQAECVPDESVGGEDGCKIFEAMEENDASVCDAITSPAWMAKCYMSVIPQSGDFLSNCKKLSDTKLKDDCVSQIALAKNSASLCSEISDASKKQFCESGLGIASKNINACDNLSATDDATGKNFCLYTYALTNADPRACDQISSNSAYKVPCNDFLNQQLSMQKKLKPNWLASAAGKILSSVLGKSVSAQTDPTNIPVGGRFLPGLYDIYTPTLIPPCLLVSVAGPNPGTFNFLPIRIYDYFSEALYHVGLNTLGLSKIVPPCPPTLFMLGSGLTPGI